MAYANKMHPEKKLIKRAVSLGSTLLVGAPVIVPAAVLGGEVMKGKDLSTAGKQALYEGTGYWWDGQKLDSGKLKEIVIRDAMLVLIGLGMRYASKRV